MPRSTPARYDILPNKVLGVQTKLALRLRNALAKLDKRTRKQLQEMGMLTTERTTAFLALALGDRKARTVREMNTRLNLASTNGTAYRALRIGIATGVVKPAGRSKYKLSI